MIARPRALIYEKLQPGDAMAAALAAAGIEAVLPFGPESALLRQSPLSEDEIAALATGFDAIIGASGAPLSRRVLEALPGLRVISKIGIGHEVIDVDAATELGIVVTNTPAQSEIDAVAEHAIALLLAAAKRLYHYDVRRMRDGGWLDPGVIPAPIFGSVVGLIGFGRIAQAVAQRLEPWGADVVASDTVAVEPRHGVRMVELDDLLEQADYVSIHAASTRGDGAILDERRLAAMKPSAVLVNTARGILVDSRALHRALRDGRLAAAALDVFDPEPPARGDELLRLSNLIATPHSAAFMPAAVREMESMAVENVRLALAGERPPSTLNPSVYDGTYEGLRV